MNRMVCQVNGGQRLISGHFLVYYIAESVISGTTNV